MRKIFFTDLDGTLLNDKKEISLKMHDALIDYMNRGNVLVLSSGRPIESVKAVVKECNLAHDNLYVIGFNGSIIVHYNTGKKMLEKSVDVDLMKQIVRIANRHNIYIHAYDDTHIVTGRESTELEFYTRTVKLPVKVLPNFPDDLDTPSCKLLAIINYDDPQKLENLGKEIVDTYGDKISCVMSNPCLLEIFSNTAGKGSAVIELCNILDIPVANSYAAGDEQNDISMLKASGCGIAMINGRDVVKENADEITAYDNNNDGLLSYFLN